MKLKKFKKKAPKWLVELAKERTMESDWNADWNDNNLDVSKLFDFSETKEGMVFWSTAFSKKYDKSKFVRELEKENPKIHELYTKAEFIKAAEISGVSINIIRFILGSLDEARAILDAEDEIVCVPDNDNFMHFDINELENISHLTDIYEGTKLVLKIYEAVDDLVMNNKIKWLEEKDSLGEFIATNSFIIPLSKKSKLNGYGIRYKK